MNLATPRVLLQSSSALREASGHVGGVPRRRLSLGLSLANDERCCARCCRCHTLVGRTGRRNIRSIISVQHGAACCEELALRRKTCVDLCLCMPQLVQRVARSGCHCSNGCGHVHRHAAEATPSKPPVRRRGTDPSLWRTGTSLRCGFQAVEPSVFFVLFCLPPLLAICAPLIQDEG